MDVRSDLRNERGREISYLAGGSIHVAKQFKVQWGGGQG
jgi:hypothetical protein